MGRANRTPPHHHHPPTTTTHTTTTRPPTGRSSEAELTRREIIDLAVRTQGAYGLTRQGPAAASGASNFWLDIHPHGAQTGRAGAADEGGDAPAARIWLLDSGDRYCPPLMYGW